MLDGLLCALIASMAWGGFRFGLVKDVFIFIIWGIIGTTACALFITHINPSEVNPAKALNALKQMGYVYAFMYAGILVTDKFLLAQTFTAYAQPSATMRVLGTIFGIAKVFIVLTIANFMHLYYAREVNPDLPNIIEKSALVQLSRGWAANIYNDMINRHWIEYEKISWEPPQPNGQTTGNSMNLPPEVQQLLNKSGNRPSPMELLKNR